MQHPADMQWRLLRSYFYLIKPSARTFLHHILVGKKYIYQNKK